MSRRRFLRLTSVSIAATLLGACGSVASTAVPSDAAGVLSAAELTTPSLDIEVTDAPLRGNEHWSRVVSFAGPSDAVEAWVAENFPGSIESTAYKADMAAYVERLGTGVQQRGDRITQGVVGAVGMLVVVGQGEEPAVHVAVHRSSR
ncbi:hypothetical protein ACXET9_15435 [Brachybacterium sp. DNPG3]